MEISAAREVILSLKQVREQKHLSIMDVKNKVDASGVFISETTLRRLFADGSEDNDSFSYESTIRPIAKVLLADEAPADDTVRKELDLYRHICEYKMEMIESLHKQIEHLKEEQAARCKKCEEKTAFLEEQIAVKDRRMDEQARRIDKLTDKLLEKI